MGCLCYSVVKLIFNQLFFDQRQVSIDELAIAAHSIIKTYGCHTWSLIKKCAICLILQIQRVLNCHVVSARIVQAIKSRVDHGWATTLTREAIGVDVLFVLRFTSVCDVSRLYIALEVSELRRVSLAVAHFKLFSLLVFVYFATYWVLLICVVWRSFVIWLKN